MLSNDQISALKTIKSKPGPFFLTGKAGTGKSYLALELKKHFRVKYTAPTGIAAQNIGGCTLHSLLGMGPHSQKANVKRLDSYLSWHGALVVDEVSMVNTELFEILYDALYGEIAFRGKLICIGDFMQLSPVTGNMAFKSPLWQNSIELIELVEQHRQDDKDFVDILDDIRVGNFSDRVAELFKDRAVKKLPEDCTNIVPHKRTAEDINEQRLMKLPGEEQFCLHEVKFSKWGINHKTTADRIERSARFPEAFRFKTGARVIMLKNTDMYVNGTTGTIIDFNVEQERIRVLADLGYEFDAYPTDEDITDATGKTVVTHTQFPMQLAWALTIHKAQGMTMDKIGIDMSNHFADGMTYVAISRIKTRDGLFLSGEARDLKVNKDALTYTKGGYSHRNIMKPSI